MDVIKEQSITCHFIVMKLDTVKILVIKNKKTGKPVFNY